MIKKIIYKKGRWILVNKIVPVDAPVHCFGIYYAKPGNHIFINKEYEKRDFSLDAISDIGKRIIKKYGEANWKKVVLDFVLKGNSAVRESDVYLFEEYTREFLYDIEQQASILTEKGTVIIQPWEYEILTDTKLNEYLKSISEKHAFIQNLGGESKNFTDKLFYLATRGIGKEAAISLIMNTISAQNLFYIYLHPGYVKYFYSGFENYSERITKQLKGTLSFDNYLNLLNQVQ